MLTSSTTALLTTRWFGLVILLVSALALNSCAALQPPSATGPSAGGPLYPLLLSEDNQRRDATIAALNRLAQTSRNSGAIEPKLQPVTGTILSLPGGAGTVLYLPKVGASAEMSEEETRESLRRFVTEWQELIGADPAKLSLVDRLDQPDGSKLANYEQRPFRYPIRGNYGKLQIRFTADRRVLDLTSSCIPDAERIQSALSALVLRPKAEDAVKLLREKGLTYSDASGAKVNSALQPASQITPRGLVIYVVPSKTIADTLEFHLTWEIDLTNAPVKTAYLDAVNGEVLATQ